MSSSASQLVVSTVLLINGPVPATYSARADLSEFTLISNLRLDGAFSATYGQGIGIKGNFWLKS